MNLLVTQRPRARVDLLEQFVYLGDQSDVDLAERFFDAVSETCSQLATHPYMGTTYNCGIDGLREMRRFPVRGFDKYLVFYLPRPTGVEVVRVLHGARDIDRIFAEEEANA